MRFDWDSHNEDHVLRHGVAPWEAEDALLDPRRSRVETTHGGPERRWAILGTTAAGRLLVVVFTRRGSSIRVVTARHATHREARRYRRRGG
jgi:uncharacterized DUF497 family protein